VDIADIMLVTGCWNTSAGDPSYEMRYGMDGDGDVDIVDIMLVAAQRGETCG
jgi:hypothetical protein